MNLSTSVLGSSACEHLRKTAGCAPDRIRPAHDLARVGCFNFVAARLLSNALHDELKVKNLRQVFEEIPPSALALPHVGVISLAVLGAAFEVKGIGGEAPLESYVRRHARQDKSGEPHITTFYTIKKRELDEQARERKERKQKKAARRNKAHQLRVERFEERSGT